MTLNVVYGSGATHDRQAAVQQLVSDGFGGSIVGTLTGRGSDQALIGAVRELLASGGEIIVQVSCSTEEQATGLVGELVEFAPVYIQAPARSRPYPHVA